MSCSRHSSVIVFGPRSDASTSSGFCCAVNFRYLRFSLNVLSISSSGPSSDASRTEPRRLRRLTHHHKKQSEPVNTDTGSTPSPAPTQDSGKRGPIGPDELTFHASSPDRPPTDLLSSKRETSDDHERRGARNRFRRDSVRTA